MSQGIDNADIERIRQIQRHPCEHGLTHCTICDGSPVVKTGLFVPTESFAPRIGQPKDKCRIVIYVLCKRCAEDPDEAAGVSKSRYYASLGLREIGLIVSPPLPRHPLLFFLIQRHPQQAGIADMEKPINRGVVQIIVVASRERRHLVDDFQRPL